MANEKRLIDANAIQWEEHYVPDPDSDKQWDYKKELCVLKPSIDAMPTVDAVEVVHGRWKYYHKQNIAVCTNCSFERDLDANFGKAISCPNCGAKMDGDRNG